jgi:hypothetical protein
MAFAHKTYIGIYRGDVLAYIDQEPILRLLNLHLQLQSCSRLERFVKVEENIFVSQTH